VSAKAALAIRDVLSQNPAYFSWPTTASEFHINASLFHAATGIKGVVGAIDGTHVEIRLPSKRFAPLMISRKQQFAVQAQAIVDGSGQFIHIHTGEFARAHDSAILERSPVPGLMEDASFVPPGYVILGDKGYPLSPKMITPFRRARGAEDQPECEKNFNFFHSRARMVVEHAFGWCKGRFRALHYSLEVEPDTANLFIESAFLLSNFINRWRDYPPALTSDAEVRTIFDAVKQKLQESCNEEVAWSRDAVPTPVGQSTLLPAHGVGNSRQAGASVRNRMMQDVETYIQQHQLVRYR